MNVIESVFPIDGKAKKYGQFGLSIWVYANERALLETALKKQSHIELAFGYFTTEHLEEAQNNRGICTLIACWEKENDCDLNDSELYEDAMFLEAWLNTIIEAKSE